ncbi:Hint domain-containing protein [Ancylobacter oerskovii]|uniref:Hint domain-containing protein n=1 Tax=Ancylobacter oerskovii TaxID=459519 RepID=A0ABW4YT09_9HYPH|nr:Hint domain-containing protein [Ancylobacter oerskovii]MBS7543369.1 Hint domain-containing protein [Ancylobacter oerskovii]
MATINVDLSESDQTVSSGSVEYDPNSATTIHIIDIGGDHTLVVDGIDANVIFTRLGISVLAHSTFEAINGANVYISQNGLSLAVGSSLRYEVGDASSISVHPGDFNYEILSGHYVDFVGEQPGSFTYDFTSSSAETPSFTVTGFGYGDSLNVAGLSFESFTYDAATGDATLIYDNDEIGGSVTFNIKDMDPALAELIAADPSAYVDQSSGAFVAPLCFLAGTHIATPQGERLVEDFRIGDLVLTASGEARPVRWIGRQAVIRVFADPLRAYPVRIAAGALEEGGPSRDLFLSPDHALLIDGVLVQASALVNGVSVTRVERPEERFTYYHLELEDHALVLAEGVPAETFVDNATRRRFDNYAEFEGLYGVPVQAIAEMDKPRVKSARQLPATIRRRLEMRARELAMVAAA